MWDATHGSWSVLDDAMRSRVMSWPRTMTCVLRNPEGVHISAALRMHRIILDGITPTSIKPRPPGYYHAGFTRFLPGLRSPIAPSSHLRGAQGRSPGAWVPRAVPGRLLTTESPGHVTSRAASSKRPVTGSNYAPDFTQDQSRDFLSHVSGYYVK